MVRARFRVIDESTKQARPIPTSLHNQAYAGAPSNEAAIVAPACSWKLGFVRATASVKSIPPA